MDLRKKHVHLEFEQLISQARRRVRNIAGNHVALTTYVNACGQCRGMGWTWCCFTHQQEGGPPNERCEHYSNDEVGAYNDLVTEMKFLDEVEKELRAGKIEVASLDSDFEEMPDALKQHFINHHKNAPQN